MIRRHHDHDECGGGHLPMKSNLPTYPYCSFNAVRLIVTNVAAGSNAVERLKPSTRHQLNSLLKFLKWGSIPASGRPVLHRDLVAYIASNADQRRVQLSQVLRDAYGPFIRTNAQQIASLQADLARQKLHEAFTTAGMAERAYRLLEALCQAAGIVVPPKTSRSKRKQVRPENQLPVARLPATHSPGNPEVRLPERTTLVVGRVEISFSVRLTEHDAHAVYLAILAEIQRLSA